jgi:2-polyprenyl-3-methyl-5-hydroxy-6-metoxy-1,4-benzoquinol methylase
VKPIIEQTYWDDGYEALPMSYRPERVELKDVFARHISTGDACLEIGCYPGDYLIYLGRTFGCTVSGVDLTPKVELLAEHIRKNGALVGTIEKLDFIAMQETTTYDVVFSWGFIEHFENFEEIIEKHARLVKPGGKLILGCPNFRNLQYLLHLLCDPINLRRHNLRAMDLKKWRRTLRVAGLSVLECGFYRTAQFWVDTPRLIPGIGHIVYRLQKTCDWIDSHIAYPNTLLSPYIYIVARK